jgi:hypothetical protein
MVYHWSLTLVFAPILVKCIDFLFNLEPSIIGELSIYPVTFIFSILFSLPTMAVYSAWFFFIERHQKSIIWVKTSLIIIAVLGIYLTFATIKLNIGVSSSYGYCITAIVIGYLERLKPREELIDPESDTNNTTAV